MHCHVRVPRCHCSRGSAKKGALIVHHELALAARKWLRAARYQGFCVGAPTGSSTFFENLFDWTVCSSFRTRCSQNVSGRTSARAPPMLSGIPKYLQKLTVDLSTRRVVPVVPHSTCIVAMKACRGSAVRRVQWVSTVVCNLIAIIRRESH
ncbi:hypothetical protein PYCCODRAFT_173167 [Trametes coccinea BRFM310]|uniref:Uncharacterized protein n=1 Tax=Trametes coccinea (strain BRFM310) TaxID=1353009 RepID=A0A1Y2ISF8_TRAC3|nr:hypothetical protein PYCCODRAFT_173167 [Trametes coccinea BRFM310]